MRISVIGAGALGTFYATMLAAAGEDVTLVCRPKDAAALGQGLAVAGAIERAARPRIAAKPPLSDVVFVTVKAYDIAGAVQGIPLAPGTIVVVLYNGLGGDEAAAAVLGPGRVAVGISYSGVTFLGPGRVRLAGYTKTLLGSRDPVARGQLDKALLALTRAGLKAALVEDIRAAQWEKLFANVGINAITAITGLPNGGLLEVPGLRELSLRAVREAEAVARAAGVPIAIDPAALALQVIRDTRDNRSSMLQDVARGRRTEIDFLNGQVCSLGRSLGVATPANDALVALIKGIEKGAAAEP